MVEGTVISYLEGATVIKVVDYEGNVVAEISEDGVYTSKSIEEVRVSYEK